MQSIGQTGWRSLSPVVTTFKTDFESVSKPELFKAARMAARALGLKPAARFLLEQLAGFYGGEVIEGRLLVWPSNELLSERTGLSERTIRYAARALLLAGAIGSKDSANGKRYARRSRAGQIIGAFGFDLSPLLVRAEEFTQRVQALKDQERERRAAFDELTVHRRATQQTLATLREWFPAEDITALEARFESLVGSLPRRGSKEAVDPILARFSELRQECETRFNAACGGKNRRHKDINNDTPDQSWNNGQDESRGGTRALPRLDLAMLREACPEAFAFTSEIRNERELVVEASNLRGGLLGAHLSAWEEACENLGPTTAAVAFFVVLQLYSSSVATAKPILNPGGYYRAYVRKIGAKEIDVVAEIERLRQRRRH